MRKLLTLLVFFVSVYCSGQKLKLTIYNKTGYDVDSISIGDAYVGRLKKDDSTVVLNCTDFLVEQQDSVPVDPHAQGMILNKMEWRVLGCGTGYRVSPETKSGEFKFDLTYEQDFNHHSLFWRKHGSKPRRF